MNYPRELIKKGWVLFKIVHRVTTLAQWVKDLTAVAGVAAEVWVLFLAWELPKAPRCGQRKKKKDCTESVTCLANSEVLSRLVYCILKDATRLGFSRCEIICVE